MDNLQWVPDLSAEGLLLMKRSIPRWHVFLQLTENCLGVVQEDVLEADGAMGIEKVFWQVVSELTYFDIHCWRRHMSGNLNGYPMIGFAHSLDNCTEYLIDRDAYLRNKSWWVLSHVIVCAALLSVKWNRPIEKLVIRCKYFRPACWNNLGESIITCAIKRPKFHTFSPIITQVSLFIYVIYSSIGLRCWSSEE